MDPAKELFRDTYRNLSYVVFENPVDPVDATSAQGITGCSVYFHEETNPKLVFPNDLVGNTDWASLKDNAETIRSEIERHIDTELDSHVSAV